MRYRPAALVAVFVCVASIVQASSVGFSFEAIFVEDSVSKGEAGADWSGPQRFEDLSAGDSLLGGLSLGFLPPDSSTTTSCDGADCPHSFVFPRLSMCGTGTAEFVELRSFTAGRGADIELSSGLTCLEEAVRLTFDGHTGTMTYSAFPDDDYLKSGSYTAVFALSGVTETITPMPLPASGWMLLGGLVLGGWALRRRARG